MAAKKRTAKKTAPKKASAKKRKPSAVMGGAKGPLPPKKKAARKRKPKPEPNPVLQESAAQEYPQPYWNEPREPKHWTEP